LITSRNGHPRFDSHPVAPTPATLAALFMALNWDI
jgi:hypothetical protein